MWGPIVAGVLLVAAFVRHVAARDAPADRRPAVPRAAFSAAAATTFLVGAALFGAMILLPLYYQVARGEDALTAGLLMAPQGLGAALAMPLAGRLTDRVGGGRVALVGPARPARSARSRSRSSTARRSYTLLACLLVVRGLGIGGVDDAGDGRGLRDARAASDVPRATRALNALQRIGGSIGTAVLAVVLQGEIKDQLAAAQVGQSAPAASGTLERLPEELRQRLAEPLAAAFATTFWWAVGISVLALIPATILALSQRRDREEAEAEAAAELEPESLPV